MTRRYPLEALVSASGMSEAALARRVGLSGTTLKTAREHGLVETAADRYAVRAGLVPWLVWPDWLEDVAEPCEGCGEPFVPKRRGQRYCTTACNRRTWDRAAKRRRYREDPEFAAAERERAKAYRAVAGRAVKAKEAAYRERNRDHLAARARAYYEANAERLKAKERERYHARRGTSVEQSAGDVSPGQSDISGDGSDPSHTRGTVAA